MPLFEGSASFRGVDVLQDNFSALVEHPLEVRESCSLLYDVVIPLYMCTISLNARNIC